jgi:HEAT repeat protein
MFIEFIRGGRIVDTVKALLAQLNSDDEIERRVAVFELSEIGSPAVDLLERALEDQQPYVRAGAGLALARMADCPPSAIPKIGHQLADSSQYVRRCAAAALGSLGGRVVPLLCEALRSDSAEEVCAATMAISQIGVAAKDAIGPLAPLLNHADDAIRRQAAIALGHVLQDEPERALKPLYFALKAGDRLFAESTVITLRETRSKSDEVLIALIYACLQMSGPTRREALLAIHSIDPSVKIGPAGKQFTCEFPARISARLTSMFLQGPAKMEEQDEETESDEG